MARFGEPGRKVLNDIDKIYYALELNLDCFLERKINSSTPVKLAEASIKVRKCTFHTPSVDLE